MIDIDTGLLQLRVAELELQLADIRAELAKYLLMSPQETIVGGIRNLVQASMMNAEVAKKAMSLWREQYEDTSQGGEAG